MNYLKTFSIALCIASSGFLAALQEPEHSNNSTEVRLSGDLQIFPPNVAENIVSYLQNQDLVRLAQTGKAGRMVTSQILQLRKKEKEEYEDFVRKANVAWSGWQ